MSTKKLWVSLIAVVALALLVSLAGAAEITTDPVVEINNIIVDGSQISVVAGETIRVEVFFTANVDDTNVKMEVELEGEGPDVEATTASFDVLEGRRYVKTVTIRVPHNLDDERDDEITLDIKIRGDDHRTDLNPITLTIQRPSFEADIKSIISSNRVKAGETFPVEVVVKNVGFNDLQDVFISVRIPTLGVEQEGFLGDIVALEKEAKDEDDEDTLSARLFLTIPFNAEPGQYALEVEVVDEDQETTATRSKQITVVNDFVNNLVVLSNTVNVADVGDETQFRILVVNPTSDLKVFRIIAESTQDVSTTVQEPTIAVPAGSSQTVTITAVSKNEGRNSFNVQVLSASEVVGRTTLAVESKGGVGDFGQTPVVVWTIILIIIFLVLVAVLVVLLQRKPRKAAKEEEFGESYY